MEILQTIILLAILIGVPTFISLQIDKRKKEKLKEQNKIVERDRTFITQKTIFTTKEGNLNDIGKHINRTALEEEKVLFKPNYVAGMILFTHSDGFRASLRSIGAEGERFRYEYYVEGFKSFKNTDSEYTG